MLPVVLLISLFAAGTLGYVKQPELEKKVVSLPIPKAVVQGKPLRQDSAFDQHQIVPIKKTEVRRVVEKVPLVHEVPIIITKNKPFYQPQVVPRPIVVHEVVGLPIVRDKHVVQPVYIDRPYVVEKKQFVDQPYPVEKPIPIDFVKRITKVYDRKVEVPHIVSVPLVKTVDRPRPVPYTREVLQHYDVHVNVPRPRPVKVVRHRTHVEKVPFETPNLIVRKRPVPHEINEFIPQVPQVHVEKFRLPNKAGIDGQVLAGTQEDAAVTAEARQFGPGSGGRIISAVRGPDGPVVVAPREPVLLNVDTVDAQTGQRIPEAAIGARGASAGPARVVGVSAPRQGGGAVLLGQDLSGPGVASLGPALPDGPGFGPGGPGVGGPGFGPGAGGPGPFVGGGGGGAGVVFGGGAGVVVGGGGPGPVVVGGAGDGPVEVVDIGPSGEGIINIGPGGLGQDIEIVAVGPDGKDIGSFVLGAGAIAGGLGKKG